jgi:hypothetical protein
MSPQPPVINPSQTVERIREIIVGRQLERLEQRVTRIESAVRAGPSAPGLFEDRLFANEAQIEALKESVHRLSVVNRDQTELRFDQHRDEIQRLAGQIQQVAAQKSAASPHADVLSLERKVSTWLTDWQGSIKTHLADRDRRLVAQLRDEFAAVWEHTESQITRLESRAVDRDSIEERFNRIALAARALAECASPTASPDAATTRNSS